MMNQTEAKGSRLKKFFNFQGGTGGHEEVESLQKEVMQDSRGKIRVLNFDNEKL